MTLMVKSWRLRESARAALAAGQLAQAVTLVEKAQQIQGAPAGEALKVISSLLRQSTGTTFQPFPR